MSDRRRISRRLAVFALIGALGFGGGWAVAQAWPGEADKPSHEMHPDTTDVSHGGDHDD